MQYNEQETRQVKQQPLIRFKVEKSKGLITQLVVSCLQNLTHKKIKKRHKTITTTEYHSSILEKMMIFTFS